MIERYCSYVGKTIVLNNEHEGKRGDRRFKWCSSRPMYFGDTFVIKFDETIRGRKFKGQQSTAEILLWERLDDKDRKHFVTLLDYSYEEGWIAQERINIIRTVPTKEQRAIVKGLKKKFGIRDILGVVMANWTVRKDGSPVIYDWGSNEEIHI